MMNGERNNKQELDFCIKYMMIEKEKLDSIWLREMRTNVKNN